MFDPHMDALDHLHEALSDKIASRFKKKLKPEDEEKKPTAIEVSVTKAGEGHDETDGDEVPDEPPEEEAHEPTAADHALKVLKMLRKR